MTTGYIMLDTPNRAAPQGTYPRRGGARLSGTCIVHTSEGNWRSGVAGLTNLVRTRADYGCYHRACDWEDIDVYYPWEWECWQDSETNNWAAGIAAACRASDWATMPADISEGYYRNMGVMAADFVKYMRDQYGVTVPLRRLSGAEARARVPGFAAHGDSGLHRSDPGRDFDWAKFFAYTAQALTGGINYQSASITPLEDDMANVPQDQWDHALKVINSLADNAATKKDLRDVVDPRTLAPVEKEWVFAALRSLVENVSTKSDIDKVLDASAIAASIPDNLAQDVVDALAARIGGK